MKKMTREEFEHHLDNEVVRVLTLKNSEEARVQKDEKTGRIKIVIVKSQSK